MKNFALTTTLAVLLLVGLNVPSKAFAPQTRVTLASGPSEVVNIVLHDASASYIVPLGKVLHLDHIM